MFERIFVNKFNTGLFKDLEPFIEYILGFSECHAKKLNSNLFRHPAVP